MLRKLRIKNGIKYTDSSFDFKEGLTIIKGQNGKGKSLIQEFIRFALFGSCALRGKVSDYPSDMEISLDLDIKDKSVLIIRGLKDCTVKCDGEIVSRGTTACNSWIVECLGYDVNVFDMGNCAKQMEINKLGRMKPSERKNAIDQVIGLNIISKLIKELKEERSELKSYCSGVESALVEPQWPEKPENYTDSFLFKKELDEKVSLRTEYESILKSAEYNKTDEPSWNNTTVPTGNLSDEGIFKFLTSRKNELIRAGVEGSKYSEEELTKWLKSSDEWRDYIEPELDEDTIKSYLDKWEEYEHYERMKKITCPKCGNVFSLEGELKDVEKPSKSKEYLNEQMRRHLRKPKLDKPEVFIDNAFVKNELMLIKNEKDYKEVCSQLTKFTGIDFDLLREYEDYKKKLDAWNKYKLILQKLESYPVDKIVSKEETDKLQVEYFKFVQYESDLKRYLMDKEKYDKNLKALNEKKKRIDALEVGVSGLTKFMSLVKSSIIPSLSKISSDVVSEISNCKIKKIEIEDDFTIKADGKEICLLSGGEEAIVNLAIRLALSSVLTRKALSVFIGDEIDQSMDEEHAKNTADILRRLTNQIAQVILITHKDVDGDNYIDI